MSKDRLTDAILYGCLAFALFMVVMAWCGGCEVRVRIESQPREAPAAPASKPLAEPSTYMVPVPYEIPSGPRMIERGGR